MSLHSWFMPVMVQFPTLYETAALEKNSRSFKLIIVVQSLSHVWLYDSMGCNIPGFPLLHHLLELTQKLMSIMLVPPNHLVLHHLLFLLPSIFPCIRVLPNELALCIRWPKYLSFSFSISPSSEYSGLIFFRIDWFDLFAVQGTLKSLLKHNSKASILQQ